MIKSYSNKAPFCGIEDGSIYLYYKNKVVTIIGLCSWVRLQLSQNGLGITACNAALLGLLSVGDLAVVNDDGIAAGALAHGPPNGL